LRDPTSTRPESDGSVCHPRNDRKFKIRKSWSRPGKKQDPRLYLKHNDNKRLECDSGGRAPALSSNPSIIKKFHPRFFHNSEYLEKAQFYGGIYEIVYKTQSPFLPESTPVHID
jgi:hypothetical protein